MSLLCARILGDAAATEAASSPELTKAKRTIKELRAELDEAEIRITDAEDRAITAGQRFAAAGDLFARLFAEENVSVSLLRLNDGPSSLLHLLP